MDILVAIWRGGRKMLIGLTGENCSGKGSVAEYLKRKGLLSLM
jgi:dephospho-CoA kinase